MSFLKAAVTQVWYDNPPAAQCALGKFQQRLNHKYLDLFTDTKMLPYTLLPVSGVSPKIMLDGFDLLLLTGGGDPSPSLFGQENKGSRNPRPYRSTWDMQLYHAAREIGIPVLGICLGMQLIGIAEGVGLTQDLPESAVFHDGSFTKSANHTVTITPDSFLHSIYGNEKIVTSFHHQALEAAPEGYTVTAIAEDGVIEAIEGNNSVGVQWHPEREEDGQLILKAIIKRMLLNDI